MFQKSLLVKELETVSEDVDWQRTLLFAEYLDLIKQNLIDIKDHGSFRLNLDYFDYCTGLTMTNARFAALFGAPPRKPEAPLTRREMDLAASVQAVTEEVVLKLADTIAGETGESNLCLAGGVALNCVANGKALGWHQGRMEFGPRALGGRSILGDARSTTMQKLLNLKVKYRESFRPFAPSVLREDLCEWFELDVDSPYMLLVADVAPKLHIPMTAEQRTLFGIDRLNVPRSSIPAVTHIDYSARIQTVHRETNPRYHALISRFKTLTACPVIVNTSFNVRGEPIVCTPEDAFRCFMGTDIEALAVGNCYLRKEDQNPAFSQRYAGKFDLD